MFLYENHINIVPTALVTRPPELEAEPKPEVELEAGKIGKLGYSRTKIAGRFSRCKGSRLVPERWAYLVYTLFNSNMYSPLFSSYSIYRHCLLTPGAGFMNQRRQSVS